MKEIISRCSVQGCKFPSGECSFVSDAKKIANTFRVDENENGSFDVNEAAKRWGIIMHEEYNRLSESDCVRKDEIGTEMESIIPDKLRSHTTGR